MVSGGGVPDDVGLIRGVLPLLVEAVSGDASSFVLEGSAFSFEVACDAYLDGEPLDEAGLASLSGTVLEGIEAPGDGFDPCWVLADGRRLVLKAGDEGAPWAFTAGEVVVEGPGLELHEAWLRGDLQDIEP